MAWKQVCDQCDGEIKNERCYDVFGYGDERKHFCSLACLLVWCADAIALDAMSLCAITTEKSELGEQPAAAVHEIMPFLGEPADSPCCEGEVASKRGMVEWTRDVLVRAALVAQECYFPDVRDDDSPLSVLVRACRAYRKAHNEHV